MKKHILSLTIIFLILSINFATSPLPPPYYTYKISGSVICDSLINLSNHSVLLFGVGNEQNYNDSTYVVIEGMGNKYENPIANTNGQGEYFLSVDSPFLFDSVKTCVIIKNESVAYSVSLDIDSAKLWEVTEPYTPPITEISGCTGCSVEPEEIMRTVKYEYSINDVIVDICKEI